MQVKYKEDIKKYTYWKNAEIPIVIGVSAHREIENKYIPEIEKKVSGVIDYFLKEYPHSPILMLNGMAKGGDLLCAKVAKEKFENGNPVRICMVIPDEEQAYLNGCSKHGDDFSLEDKKLYNDIKNCKTQYGKLVIDDIPFVVPDMEKTGETTRQYKFRQQAIYVATKCHVLLALWDGKGAKGVNDEGIKNTDCGTPAAVQFALKHNYIQPFGTEFYSAYDGAVIKILSPRKGNVDENAGKRTYLTSENPEVETTDFPQKLKEILVRTDLFNKNYYKYCKKQKRILSKQEKAGEDVSNLIVPKESRFLLGKDEYDNGSDKLKRIHDCCKIASELSAENKKKFGRSLFVLGFFGFLLTLGFMLYDQLNLLWTVVGFRLMIIALWIGYMLIKATGNPHVITWLKLKGKPCGVQTKAIEYRALSETMRVQYFLCACGVYYNVSNYFTWSHKNEIVWIKKAVTALFIGNDVDFWQIDALKQKYHGTAVAAQIVRFNGGECEKSACLDKIFSKWVGKDENFADKNLNGQVGYHLKNKEETDKKLKKQHIVSTLATCFTVFAYFVLFSLELLVRLNIITQIDLSYEFLWIINGRMLFKITLCVLSAITFFITYYYGKQALKRNSADSENMINLCRMTIYRAQSIFKNDLYYCTDKDKEAAFKSLLKELAHEQITENGMWIFYNRESRMNLPL